MTSNIGDRVQRKVTAVLHRTTQLSPCSHSEKAKLKILYLNSRINHRELANTEVLCTIANIWKEVAVIPNLNHCVSLNLDLCLWRSKDAEIIRGKPQQLCQPHATQPMKTNNANLPHAVVSVYTAVMTSQLSLDLRALRETEKVLIPGSPLCVSLVTI